jgi:predicted transcriptional regulator
MTAKTLQHLIEDVASWPEEDQRELADYARAIHARRTGRYLVSEAERAALAEAMEQADRGEFVPEATVSAADRRHGA